jgi:hypothetical protein
MTLERSEAIFSKWFTATVKESLTAKERGKTFPVESYRASGLGYAYVDGCCFVATTFMQLFLGPNDQSMTGRRNMPFSSGGMWPVGCRFGSITCSTALPALFVSHGQVSQPANVDEKMSGQVETCPTSPPNVHGNDGSRF